MFWSIPSPPESIWYLGPVPLRAYALCIITGALIAIWIGEKRLQARGGRAGAVSDAAVWALPFGIVGGRAYHVITHYQDYFGADKDFWTVFKVWEGGLAIWGAIAFGALGVWIASRVHDFDLIKMADAIAPGLLIAQGIGRLGNWFNQELFGVPTTLPWGLEISIYRRPPGYEMFETFHPTFLYELLWNFAAAAVLIAIDRRVNLTHMRAFAMYLMLYSAGRLITEYLRIDPANVILGLRVNMWTTLLVFVGGALLFWWGTQRANADPSSQESRTSAS